ncbi:hypothetical protein BDZ89DRAFT_343495 [Hymenopellis radicata]|nr:hypothetical protein BDZ89DRAFT_343495 [Hymenopellis radicata]
MFKHRRSQLSLRRVFLAPEGIQSNKIYRRATQIHCRFGRAVHRPRRRFQGELFHLRQPLELKVFTRKRMAAKLEKIGDDESRMGAHAEDHKNAEEEAAADEVDGENKAADGTERKPRKLVKDEHRRTGGVKLKISPDLVVLHLSIFLFLVLFDHGLRIVEKLWRSRSG